MNRVKSHKVGGVGGGVDVGVTSPNKFRLASTDVSSSLGDSPWKMIPIAAAAASASASASAFAFAFASPPASPSIMPEVDDHHIDLGSLGPFSLSFAAMHKSESSLAEAVDTLVPAPAPTPAPAPVAVMASFDSHTRSAKRGTDDDDDSRPRRSRQRRRFPPPPAPGSLPTLEEAEQTPQSCRRRQTQTTNSRINAPTTQPRSRSTSHHANGPFDSPCPRRSSLTDESHGHPGQAGQVDNEEDDDDQDPANLIDQMLAMLDVDRRRGPVAVTHQGAPGVKISQMPEGKDNEEERQ